MAKASGKGSFVKGLLRKKRFWALVIIGGLIVYGGIQIRNAANQAAEMLAGYTMVQEAEVYRSTISHSVAGSGSLTASHIVDVLVPAGMTVETVEVEAGDVVEEGQILATLNKASIAGVIAEVEDSIDAVKNKLNERGLSSYEKERLQAQRDDLIAILNELKLLYDNPVIVAGEAGVINKVNISAGDTISGGAGTSAPSTDDNNSDLSGYGSYGHAVGIDAIMLNRYMAAATLSEYTLSPASVSSTDIQSVLLTADTEADTEQATVTLQDTDTAGSDDSSGSTSGSMDDPSQKPSGDSSDPNPTPGPSDETDAPTPTPDPTPSLQPVTDYRAFAIQAPVTGAKPQDDYQVVGNYALSVEWFIQRGQGIVNADVDTFQADTVYVAKYTLTAWPGLSISEDSLPLPNPANNTSSDPAAYKTQIDLARLPGVTAGQLSDLSLSDAEITLDQAQNVYTLTQYVTFPATEKEATPDPTMPDETVIPETEIPEIDIDGGFADYSSISGVSGGSSANTSITYTSRQAATFSIICTDEVKVVINVDELDILSISKGQRADITLDAVPGEVFEGEISKVASTSSSQGGNAKYSVEIRIPMTDQMRIGMTASASVIVDEAVDVLTIPMAALQQRGEETFVYTGKTETDEMTDPVTVTTGLSDGTFVEIIDGIDEGTTVYYMRDGINEEDYGMEFYYGY